MTNYLMYIYQNNNKHIISHNGNTGGCISLFNVEYSKDWKVKNIYIKFETVKI